MITPLAVLVVGKVSGLAALVAILLFFLLAWGVVKVGDALWQRVSGDADRQAQTLRWLVGFPVALFAGLVATATAGYMEGATGLQAAALLCCGALVPPSVAFWRWRSYGRHFERTGKLFSEKMTAQWRSYLSIAIGIGAATLAVGVEGIALALLF